MTDYIKREDAIEYLVDNMVWMDADGIETNEEDKRDAIAELINGVPSADVAPVRHGRWIYQMDDLYPEESTMKCSVCGDFIFIRGESDNYCPNCGAKMDGGDTDA